MTFDLVHRVLLRPKFQFSNEYQLQDQIERLFSAACVAFIREAKLSSGERVDFFFPTTGLAVEVKFRDSQGATARQLKRYCNPVISEYLGLKKNQASGILMEEGGLGLSESSGESRVKDLARAYLSRKQ
jgi:hypothetical protein